MCVYLACLRLVIFELDLRETKSQPSRHACTHIPRPRALHQHAFGELATPACELAATATAPGCTARPRGI